MNSNTPQIITIDTADIDIGLSVIEQQQIAQFLQKLREARTYRGLPPLQGIFIPVEDPSFPQVVEVYQSYHQEDQEDN